MGRGVAAVWSGFELFGRVGEGSGEWGRVGNEENFFLLEIFIE